ncbi:MAG: glycosyltransferase family 2 protein [Acidobacteria bacterium]|nr:glycosyltransferase family 2 protein [Acidobacteriota bacterium]
MISVVIPTYKEADSIQEVIRRAAATLSQSGEEYELIVVDDNSGDGTAELAEELAQKFPVRVLRRPGRQGLATAVVAGWGIARGDMLGVIDSDLQHPPEILTPLARALRSSNADLAIASRYVAGGGTSDWKLSRRLISRGATHLAASVLPLKLATVSDPMSGMFLVRSKAIKGAKLSPLGYKILLEVLGKGQIEKIAEVAYQFEVRTRGSSKLGFRQYGEYLTHLMRLSWSTGQIGAWVEYSIVGLTGTAVDLGLVYWGAERAGWGVAWALPVAVQAALLWNFLGNQLVTFPQPTHSNSPKSRILTRFLLYEKACLPGALLNICLTLLLAGGGTRLILAAACGVLVDGAFNLLFKVPAIWRVWGSPISVSHGDLMPASPHGS